MWSHTNIIVCHLIHDGGHGLIVALLGPGHHAAALVATQPDGKLLTLSVGQELAGLRLEVLRGAGGLVVHLAVGSHCHICLVLLAIT